MTSTTTSTTPSPEGGEGHGEQRQPRDDGSVLTVLLGPFRFLVATVFLRPLRFLFVTVPLWWLYPFRLFFRSLAATGPILKREFIGLLRTKKIFRITLITLVASSLLPLLSWPQAGEPMAYRAAMVAFEIYRGVFNFALFLFVPAITASAITTEREQNTHELLFMSHITNGQLVLGKLVAASGIFWLLVAFTFPIACTLYLLGGFAIWDFLITGIGMIFFIVSLGMIGLSCSIRNHSTPKSIFQAYTFTFLLGLMAAYGGAGGGWILSRFAFGDSGLAPGTWVWLGVYAAFCFVGALFGLDLSLSFRSLARFQRLPPRHRARRVLRSTQLRKPRKRPVWRTGLTRRVLERASEGVPDGWNPFFVVSVRNDIFGSAAMRRSLFWGFAGICGFVILLLKLTSVPMTVAAAVCGMLILHSLALFFPAACASMVSSELQPRLLELLRGTHLGSHDLFKGKLLAIFFGLSGLAIVAAGLCLLCALLAGSWPQFLGAMNVTIWVVAALPVVVLVVASSGFLAAVLSRSTIQAQITSYSLSIGYLLGLPVIIYGFLGSTVAASLSSPIFTFSPVFLRHYEHVDPTSLEGNLIFAGSLLVGSVVGALQYLLAVAVYRARLARD